MLFRFVGTGDLRQSAAESIQVLIAHTGGPFWSRRDLAAWSIPKGEVDPDETPEQAARREFAEELGVSVPSGELIHLGEVTQRNRKVVTAWAVHADLDPASVVPGTVELEWPPGSGQLQQVPEIDRVAWFSIADARPRLFAGQDAFLDRLIELVGADHDE